MVGSHTVRGTPIDGVPPDGFAEAVFGMGCFWGAERVFWNIPGVWTTAVGYAGGNAASPTYEQVCTGLTGHAEVVRVVYDPATVSFETLLKAFWEEHDPTQGMRQGNDVGSQYRSTIYPTTATQLETALTTRDAYGQQTGRGRIRRNHDGDQAARRVLLRGGLSPAVPVGCEEPVRLLRFEGH